MADDFPNFSFSFSEELEQNCLFNLDIPEENELLSSIDLETAVNKSSDVTDKGDKDRVELQRSKQTKICKPVKCIHRRDYNAGRNQKHQRKH